MKNQKRVEKYTYRVEWSEEDGVHLARCLEFPSLMVHGDTPESALVEIESVVEETIKWMQEQNETVPEPFGLKKYKGNLTLRVPVEIHRKLAIRSAEEGISVNQYILSKIS
jgi:predicted RNase H-like HicB family nuclease